MTSRMIRAKIFFIFTVMFAFAAAELATAQINFTPAGIEIDAQGVLRVRLYTDPTGELTRQRFLAAQANLNADIQKPSDLRKVSLTRLEQAIAKRLESGAALDQEMLSLAGLTQITHVFYYPESKEIVVAGPAEGFYADVSGRVVGMQTGKAILRLEDLIVALRAFPPSGPTSRVIGCSIDPTQAGLQQYSASYQQLLRQLGNTITGREQLIVETLRNALGMQEVTVKGVSPKSHFAQVLVEADYRMKLIGIGLEQPPVNIPSWVSLVNPAKASKNALQRWYFTPDYDRVRVNEDETAMQLVGNGIKLLGEDEMVHADGSRVSKGNANRASSNFCRNFTEKYDELAATSPVFAELRNLMDISIAAAFIQEMDYYGQAGWNMPVFADESRLSVENYAVPTHVEPAINAIWKNNLFMAPIGGGVNIQARQALTADNMKRDRDGVLDRTRGNVRPEGLPAGKWWWD